MSRLYKHVKKSVGLAIFNDEWSEGFGLYYMRDDHIVLETFKLFLLDEANKRAKKEGGTLVRLHKYVEWTRTLQPYDLEGIFTEHEIMELFSDE